MMLGGVDTLVLLEILRSLECLAADLAWMRLERGVDYCTISLASTQSRMV